MVVPLLEHYRSSAWRNSYGGMIAASAIICFVAVLLFLWARESLMKTAHNRQLSLLLNATFPAQMVFFVGAYALKVPHPHTEVLMLLLWGCFAIAATATVEKRFWPAAMGYFLAYVLAATYVDERFLFISASHAVLTLNGVYIWTRPSAQTKTLTDAQTETLTDAQTKTLTGAQTKTLTGAQTNDTQS